MLFYLLLYKKIGDGTEESKQSPVRITDGVSQVSLGGNHTCAVKTDNTLWCWGKNWSGQLGDGTAWREYPVRVKSGGGGGGAPLLYPSSIITTSSNYGCIAVGNRWSSGIYGIGVILVFAFAYILFRRRKS